MASNSGAISWFSARMVGQARLAALAVCGAMALASAAVADPIGVALIESLTGASPGVEFMDYVRTGQVIRLGPHQTIVLRYMSSCLRETITGGTVTVGTDWTASNRDPAYCRIYECYPDDATCADDLTPTDRLSLVAFTARSTVRALWAGRAIDSPSRPQAPSMGQPVSQLQAAPEQWNSWQPSS